MFSLIFSILYSVFNEHFLNLIFIKFCKHLILLKCLQNSMILSPTGPACWLDWVDSNHRPHAYQACALTTWATIHYQGVRPLWWRWWDSNPWPPACRAGALPTELHPHIKAFSHICRRHTSFQTRFEGLICRQSIVKKIWKFQIVCIFLPCLDNKLTPLNCFSTSKRN